MPHYIRNGRIYGYCTYKKVQHHLGRFASPEGAEEAAEAKLAELSEFCCVSCGERNPAKFHKGYKSRCGKCRKELEMKWNDHYAGADERQRVLMMIPPNPEPMPPVRYA